jgi:hypothetical protein
VLKKRGRAHEEAIREFRLELDHIRIGEPQRHFRDVLLGTPAYGI